MKRPQPLPVEVSVSSLGMLVALRPAHLSFSGSRWAGKVEIVVRVTVGNSHLAIYCKGDGEPVSRLHSVNSVCHTAPCRGFTAEDAESAGRKKVERGACGASEGGRPQGSPLREGWRWSTFVAMTDLGTLRVIFIVMANPRCSYNEPVLFHEGSDGQSPAN